MKRLLDYLVVFAFACVCLYFNWLLYCTTVHKETNRKDDNLVLIQKLSLQMQKLQDQVRDNDTCCSILIQQLQTNVQDLQNRTGVLEDVKTKIVGSWKMMHFADGSSVVYKFSSDGKLEYTVKTSDGTTRFWVGAYQINGNTLKITRVNDDGYDLTVIVLTDKTLIVRNPSQSINPALEFERN